jgi:DNA-binding PadR family transcriptional regulator
MLTVRLDTEVQIRNERLTRLALGVLREEPSHGYELMKQLEEEFGFQPGEISAGTLYRTPRQLERKAFATPSGRFPPRETALHAGCTRLLTPERLLAGFG